MKFNLISFITILIYFKNAFSLDFTLERFIDQECFFEDINKESKFEIQYNVIKGGFLDVDFKIIGPDHKEILRHSAKTNNEISLIQKNSGRYLFCFFNEESSKVSKQIVFSINVFATNDFNDKNQYNFVYDDKVDKTEEAKETFHRLMKSIIDISMQLNKINHEQTLIETVDISLIKDYQLVGTYVLYWAIFEILLIIAVAVYQAFYFTKIFEVRRII